MKSPRFSICGLLFRCRPTTVIRLVMTIIVETFDHHLRRWPAPHVFDEGCKTKRPSFANKNSPSAIAVIAFMVLVVASGNHPSPDVIFRPSLAFTRCAVTHFRTTGFKHFSEETSAAFCVILNQVSACNHGELSAFALAKPSDVPTFTVRKLPAYYSESVEFFAGKVQEFGHGA